MSRIVMPDCLDLLAVLRTDTKLGGVDTAALAYRLHLRGVRHTIPKPEPRPRRKAAAR